MQLSVILSQYPVCEKLGQQILNSCCEAKQGAYFLYLCYIQCYYDMECYHESVCFRVFKASLRPQLEMANFWSTLDEATARLLKF